MAMNTPVTSRSRFSRRRCAPRIRSPFTPLSSPSTSSTVVIPDDVDCAVALPLEQAVLQDLLRAQLVAPMHQRHVRGDVREVERFLDRRVAAADDRDALVAEEEAVAGGAGGDAAAAVRLLGGEPEISRARAGRDDRAHRRCSRRGRPRAGTGAG